MNTSPQTTPQGIPKGAPLAGNAARRAAFQSTAQLGRRFGIQADRSPAATFESAAPAVSRPAPSSDLMLERVLSTYSMFNTPARVA
jgi:hypothetical protein